MAESTSLESFPAEIQISILKFTPDYATVLAIIAASPLFLRSYLRVKNQIIVSVLFNQLGENLPNGLSSIRLSSTIANDYLDVPIDVSIEEARLLYMQDDLINSLVQRCMDHYSKTNVQLSDVESTRLRRGMYNFNLAARLTREQDPTISPTFCIRLSTVELLESSFVVHCLRNLAADYVVRVEAVLFKEIQNGSLQVAWPSHDFEFFSADYGNFIQNNWIANSPWTLSLRQLYDMRLVVDLEHAYHLKPNWVNLAEELPYDMMMRDEATRRFYQSNFADIMQDMKHVPKNLPPGLYCKGIPLGYMIWDEKRLSQMSWGKCWSRYWFGHEIKEWWRQREATVQLRVEDWRSEQNAKVSCMTA